MELNKIKLIIIFNYCSATLNSFTPFIIHESRLNTV